MTNPIQNNFNLLSNTRDLSGYKTISGRLIMPKRLIRSGSLSNVSKHDIDTLITYFNIDTIVDFRTETEQHQKPYPKAEKVHYISNPILSEAQVGITHGYNNTDSNPYSDYINLIYSLNISIQEYMCKLYQQLVLDKFAIKQFKNFFKILLSSNTNSILWHCTVGKDRTGIGTALLLSALEIERQTIIDDYLKTNDFILPEVNKIISYTNATLHDSQLSKELFALLTASENYIETAFNIIESTYGSINTYLRDCIGMSSEKCRLLQSKFLTS